MVLLWNIGYTRVLIHQHKMARVKNNYGQYLLKSMHYSKDDLKCISYLSFCVNPYRRRQINKHMLEKRKIYWLESA